MRGDIKASNQAKNNVCKQYQDIKKNRVNNNTKNSAIPALLSRKSKAQKFKIICFMILKIFLHHSLPYFS